MPVKEITPEEIERMVRQGHNPSVDILRKRKCQSCGDEFIVNYPFAKEGAEPINNDNLENVKDEMPWGLGAALIAKAVTSRAAKENRKRALADDDFDFQFCDFCSTAPKRQEVCAENKSLIPNWKCRFCA